MTITFDVLEMLTNILIASFVVFLLSGSVFMYGINRYFMLFMLVSGIAIVWAKLLMAGVV